MQRVRTAFGSDPPDRIGVAVSGGGDSMALLHLFLRHARQSGQTMAAVTVDHRLRPAAADEARTVATVCARHGVPHDTLVWTGWDRTGNLQAAARQARFTLMADWARRTGIGGVVLGHTRDDQAETFLMRLARRAGIDGLAAMRSGFAREGVRWARPLLGASRADLRAYLRRHSVDWAEDPSNDDPEFERVRIRRALAVLGDHGIDAQALAGAAAAVRSARSALDHYLRREAAQWVRADGGDLLMPLHPDCPDEIVRRLRARAVQWVGGLDYPPRGPAMAALPDVLRRRGKQTLAGCVISVAGDTLRIAREENAVRDLTGPTDTIWDGRWCLDGPHASDLRIAALGEAVSQCPDWRETGLPRASLMASPAVWRGDRLIAAPVAGNAGTWTARIVADFHQSLDSH